MLRRLWDRLKPQTHESSGALLECDISDIEKDGRKAFDCAECKGTRARILRHSGGRVSAVCAACGCSLFSVEVKS